MTLMHDACALTETIHNYTIVQPVITNRVDSQVSREFIFAAEL